ncbi:MAG TPA: transposase, partial [Rhodopila sp.]
PAPPAALFHYSPDRQGEHPQRHLAGYAGILQADVGRVMVYMLKRWNTFSRFLHDGRICLTNNAAERALRCVALGRKAWLFAGLDRGDERAAAVYSLIVTAKLNDVDPRVWLADVLRRIADHPASRLHELLPWHWRPLGNDTAAAA